MKKTAALLVLAGFAAACSRPETGARPAFVRKGSPAPALALTGLLNAPIRELKDLGELRGKVVILDFWATFCEPCRETIPHLNALTEKFLNKPVVFISVTDEEPAKVADFLKLYPIKGWVAPGAPAAVFRAYRVFGRPHTVVIDRDSKVAAIIRPDQLNEERIRFLLAGQTPAFGGPDGEPDGVEIGTAAVLSEFFIGEPASRVSAVDYGPGYYEGHNVPLSAALEYFYPGAKKIEADEKVRGVLAAKYELRARLPAGREGLAGFFEDGLRRSFGLKLELVKKDAPVYLLRPAPGGPKGFVRSAAGAAVPQGAPMGDGGFGASNMPVGVLCDFLRRKLDAPLLDETGLKGRYDYSFSTGSRELPVINTALIGQLGLRLHRTTRRIDVLEVSGE